MKKVLLIIVPIIVLLAGGVYSAQKVPHEVGGFALGKDISRYGNNLDTGSDLPIRHMESIREMEIVHVEGFKSGLVAYGTCDAPGKIIRIKLKYEDSRRKTYEQLLKRFKKRFGEPDEWRGDPFGIVLAWKWSFIDSQNQKISLILQHNTRDVEEKIGNAVKLTVTSQLEKELECQNKKSSKDEKPLKERQPGDKKQKAVNWNQLIPR